MNRIAAVSVFLICTVYIVGFVTIGIELGAEQLYDTTIFPSEFMGLCVLIVFPFHILWGVVAGTIDNRRGWVAGSRSHTCGNWFALVGLNAIFTIPAVILAMGARIKYGKFLPAPNEC